jgi:hypothetical protein
MKMANQQSLNQYDEVLDILNDSFESIENQVMNAITDGNVELIKSFKLIIFIKFF